MLCPQGEWTDTETPGSLRPGWAIRRRLSYSCGDGGTQSSSVHGLAASPSSSGPACIFLLKARLAGLECRLKAGGKRGWVVGWTKTAKLKKERVVENGPSPNWGAWRSRARAQGPGETFAGNLAVWGADYALPPLANVAGMENKEHPRYAFHEQLKELC